MDKFYNSEYFAIKHNTMETVKIVTNYYSNTHVRFEVHLRDSPIVNMLLFYIASQWQVGSLFSLSNGSATAVKIHLKANAREMSEKSSVILYIQKKTHEVITGKHQWYCTRMVPMVLYQENEVKCCIIMTTGGDLHWHSQDCYLNCLFTCSYLA